MKLYYILSLTLLFTSFVVKNNTCRQKKFRIEIKEESMLWDNAYHVTNDTLIIHRFNRVTQQTTHTLIKLNKDQNAEIEKQLSKMDWNGLKESYVDSSAPQDLFTYSFVFDWNKTIKKVRIYHVKQEEIFNLVKSINQMIILPGDYQIGYNDAYLGTPKK